MPTTLQSRIKATRLELDHIKSRIVDHEDEYKRLISRRNDKQRELYFLLDQDDEEEPCT